MAEHEITAPVPGTFWRKPSPDADPFVQEGDSVEAEAVVGLIEVMKQFIDVTAPAAGTVGAFQVEDGAPIAPGQVVVTLS